MEIFEGSLIFASLSVIFFFFLLQCLRNVCVLELRLFVQGYACNVKHSIINMSENVVYSFNLWAYLQ